jgi:hypothetical protein
LLSEFARTAESQRIIIKPIIRPFSNFEFIDKYFKGIASLRRIMSQVREHDGKTMVVELLSDAKDIREENEDITIKYPTFKRSKTFRLSFFKKSFKNKCKLRKLKPEDFIGYAILKKDRIPSKKECVRVYESVIPPTCDKNNFIRNAPEWKCLVGNKEFSVKGYLYAQQNTITNACAHVAVRSVASCYRPDSDMTYREMNTMLNIDHKIRDAEDGLTTDEIVKLLNKAGAKCFIANYTQENLNLDKLPFQKCIYGSIESGFPVIIIFRCQPNDWHAIPVFGHTSDWNAWVHRADSSYFKIGASTKYIPSESWVSMYIGHDDNFGSNFCIPRWYMYTRKHCEFILPSPSFCVKDAECVGHVIGTFPKKVKTDPIAAEVIGQEYLSAILKRDPKNLETKESWRKRLGSYWEKDQLVLRPILIQGWDYSEHLRKIKSWKGETVNTSLLDNNSSLNSDEWLWMIELSVPELFSTNKRKLGEVLINAEYPASDARNFDSFILARIPGYFVTLKDKSTQTFDYWPCGAEGHVELYGCEEK